MELSVVVTVVDAGATLAGCLTALREQSDAPEMEVIVPWDDTVEGIPALEASFPECQFLALGNVPTVRDPLGHAGQHELFDRRRSAGLARTAGDLVAILEDRGHPRPDWARRMADLHRGLSHAVIGGAVENGIDRPNQWAVYFCDFSRYQLPLSAGAAEYVTDVNISYKREALERNRELWRERYHETTLHWALTEGGETLFLSPEPVVEEHREIGSFRSLLPERFHWGRLFAYTRVREHGLAARAKYACIAPLLPLALLLRHGRMQRNKRAHFGHFLKVAPRVAVLLVAWSAGELVGYLTGRP